MSERKAVIKSLGLLLPLVLGAGARADDKRTVGELLKRIEQNTKKVKFEKSAIALPEHQKTIAPRRAENLAQVKPPARSKLYYDEGTDEARLEKVTDAGIKQLYKLTQQFRGSKRRGELWLRLAELYVEKAHLIEFRLQQGFEQKLKEVDQGKTKIRPKLDLSPSQDYNRKAVQLYEWFVRDFPTDPKIDQALFFLGYNHFELNQPEKGKAFYERLTKEHPQSPYVEESNFALGEYHFDREEWLPALKYYQAVADNPRARLFSFALYKVAWCQYKSGSPKKALQAIERVIRAGRQAKGAGDGSAGGASRIRLASEAQKDLVMFYAEAGTPRGARGYFEEVAGEKQVFGLLEKLAYYYADTGNREAARETFRDLIRERPNAPKAYDYQYQIVTMYVSSEKGNTFKTELYNWIQQYAPTSEWARANAKDKDLLARANTLIETTLRNFILQQHQTAQNSKVPEAQKAARQGYELYFTSITGSPKMDEMHFFYAELLFDMGEFDEAVAQYSWVTKNAPKSKYYEKSVLNTVLAAEKGLPSEADLKKMVGQSVEPVPFSKQVANFEAAAIRYTEGYPKGENVPAMKYKLAALYYYHNQFDKALLAFNGIIKAYPKSQYAQYAANLTLDIFNLRKDYGGLEKAGQDILANQDLANSQIGSQVKSVLQRAEFKKAQELEAKKDFPGAAKAYEEFSRKGGSTDLGVTASYNAAINYERAGDLGKAIEMYGLVMKAPGDKNADLREKSSQFVASLYEKTGQYERAAQAFELYANKHPKDKAVIPYYLNAAIIRDGLNQYGAAISNYATYFEKSRDADRFGAIFLQAKLNERRGNLSKAQDLYKQYYDARPKNAAELIESAYKVAKIFAKKGKVTDAEEWYKKVIYQQKQFSTKDKPVGISYAAECKYILVSKTFTEFRGIKIPANPARQAAAVQEKLAHLNRLKEQLKDVIRYDDGIYVSNSLSLIGQAYQHMAASIYAVPLPKGLDEATTKEYRAGVDKIAKPFEAEAIKNYESAIERGFALEGYGEGLKIAERELNRLNPEKSPDFGERASVTKMPDLGDVAADDELGSAFKSRDEKTLINAVSNRLSKDQNDLRALSALAMFYYQDKRFGAARIVLSRAEKSHADQPSIPNNLGLLDLAEDAQRPALAKFRRALELKNTYPVAAANAGSIFAEYKHWAKASELLERAYGAVKKDLKSGAGPDVGNNYALALASAGELEKAKAIYQDLLKADGGNVNALLNYTILLVKRLKDKKEGEKQLNRLKFVAEGKEMNALIDDLDKDLGGGK